MPHAWCDRYALCSWSGWSGWRAHAKRAPLCSRALASRVTLRRIRSQHIASLSMAMEWMYSGLE
eukprot:4343976-Pleurochrysis_carterae.AAC.2